MADIVFDRIDLRSFSNIWFWAMLAVSWAVATHHVLGVPADMIARARRLGGSAEEDLRDLIRIHVLRRLDLARRAGPWGPGLAAFVLTLLAVLGLVYGLEVAQAAFLLVAPQVLVAGLALRTARAIHASDGAGLHRQLGRYRAQVQMVALVSIFVTSFWGMWVNAARGF